MVHRRRGTTTRCACCGFFMLQRTALKQGTRIFIYSSSCWPYWLSSATFVCSSRPPPNRMVPPNQMVASGCALPGSRVSWECSTVTPPRPSARSSTLTQRAVRLAWVCTPAWASGGVDGWEQGRASKGLPLRLLLSAGSALNRTHPADNRIAILPASHFSGPTCCERLVQLGVARQPQPGAHLPLPPLVQPDAVPAAQHSAAQHDHECWWLLAAAGCWLKGQHSPGPNPAPAAPGSCSCRRPAALGSAHPRVWRV